MIITDRVIHNCINTILPAHVVRHLEPIAMAHNLCAPERSRGFARLYIDHDGYISVDTATLIAGDEPIRRSYDDLMIERERNIRRILKIIEKYRGEAWWDHKPTQYHVALAMWASSPTPDRLIRYVDREISNAQRAWSMIPCPF